MSDEIKVDVHSALGAYCGTFVCPKKGWKKLQTLNKDNKFPVYFFKRQTND